MRPVNEKKKKLNAHAVIIALLSFVLSLVLIELVLYIIQTANIGFEVNAMSVMLYVVPAFSIILTCIIIYVNHRTFETSNTLMEALNKVAEGNYDVTIPYKRLDNFNRAYDNFNKMTTELRSVKLLREDFVHDFSHEFKTPIASINGFANLLLEGNLNEEERKSIVRIIADETARLSNLSANMLMLYRIEGQQFIGEKKPFRLDLQITDCIILLEKQWEEKGVNITTTLKPVTYSGDAQLLKQVWLNLLSNAIKYTPKGGGISVSLAAEGGGIVARVADTGVGIAPENIGRIFDRYYQVSSGSGNGLGLAICKRICELCGGSIAVESRLNGGTVFTVKL